MVSTERGTRQLVNAAAADGVPRAVIHTAVLMHLGALCMPAELSTTRHTACNCGPTAFRAVVCSLAYLRPRASHLDTPFLAPPSPCCAASPTSPLRRPSPHRHHGRVQVWRAAEDAGRCGHQHLRVAHHHQQQQQQKQQQRW